MVCVPVARVFPPLILFAPDILAWEAHSFSSVLLKSRGMLAYVCLVSHFKSGFTGRFCWPALDRLTLRDVAASVVVILSPGNESDHSQGAEDRVGGKTWMFLNLFGCWFEMGTNKKQHHMVCKTWSQLLYCCFLLVPISKHANSD